jgi:hypothetical protein
MAKANSTGIHSGENQPGYLRLHFPARPSCRRVVSDHASTKSRSIRNHYRRSHHRKWLQRVSALIAHNIASAAIAMEAAGRIVAPDC